jgi:hypothetical protein
LSCARIAFFPWFIILRRRHSSVIAPLASGTTAVSPEGDRTLRGPNLPYLLSAVAGKMVLLLLTHITHNQRAEGRAGCEDVTRYPSCPTQGTILHLPSMPQPTILLSYPKSGQESFPCYFSRARPIAFSSGCDRRTTTICPAPFVPLLDLHRSHVELHAANNQ